eukprot:scaffold4675_cov101-Cylindrotheca_fusiformis.AAC.7
MMQSEPNVVIIPFDQRMIGLPACNTVCSSTSVCCKPTSSFFIRNSRLRETSIGRPNLDFYYDQRAKKKRREGVGNPNYDGHGMTTRARTNKRGGRNTVDAGTQLMQNKQ